MVTIIKDKEPIYDVEDFDAIFVGVSTHNMLMGSFSAKIGIKYPNVKDVYERTPYGDKKKLGKRLTFEDTTPTITLMFICGYPSRKAYYVDYAALERCLKTANAEFKGKKVITTILGSSRYDGNGDKNKCLKLLTECCKDIDLYVYDYKQIDAKAELHLISKYFRGLKEQFKDDKEKLKEIRAKEKETIQKCYLPVDYFVNRSIRNKEDDDILNI